MIQLWRRITAAHLTYTAGAWLLDQLPGPSDRCRVFESRYHLAFLCRFMRDMAVVQGRGRVADSEISDALAMSVPKLQLTYKHGERIAPALSAISRDTRTRAENDAEELAHVLRGLSPGGKPAGRSSAECLEEALRTVRTKFESTLPAFYGVTMCLPLI